MSIVEASRWLAISLPTVDDGLYYQLQGLIRADGSRITEEQWLESLRIVRSITVRFDVAAVARRRNPTLWRA